MMETRTRILTLAGVVVVLAAAYAAGLLLSRPPAVPVVVHPFDAGSVKSVVAGSVHLRKNAGGAWQVRISGGWYPADSGKVKAMLSTVSGLTASRVASRSKRDWKTFQVDPQEATPLVLSSGTGTLVRLAVGESSSSGGVYVRAGTRMEVYEVSGKLSDFVSGGPTYWSYLRIFPASLSIDSLESISITAHHFSVGGQSVNQSYLLVSSVVGGKSGWVVRGKPGLKLDPQKVLSLEGEIVDMVGDRFVTGTDRAAVGLKKPTAVVTLADQQGKTWSLLVGEHHGSQFYVAVKGQPYIYLVNQWTLHRAIPPLNSLSAHGS